MTSDLLISFILIEFTTGFILKPKLAGHVLHPCLNITFILRQLLRLSY